MTVTFAEIAQLVTAVAAIAAVIVSLLNRGKIHEVHLSMNSRLSELLKVTAEAAHSNGAKEERERQKDNVL